MKYTAHQICILDDYSNFSLPKNVETIKTFVSGSYILWKDKDIIDLITNNFSSDVLQAYTTLKANALKSDLARYCVLYIYGGWYFDLLMTVDGNLADYSLEEYEMLVFRDIPISDKTTLPVSNSIIWVKAARNYILKDAIDSCVKNVLNKTYPRTSHRITGPSVLGSAIARRCLQKEDTSILVGDLSFCNENGHGEFTIVSWPQRKRMHFAWHRLPDLEDALPNNYQKGSYYTKMYEIKDLYHG